MIKFQDVYICLFKDVKIFFYVFVDTDNCKEFLKVTFQSWKPNNYMDIYYPMDQVPNNLADIFLYTKKKNKISASPDETGYIFQGPCLKTGNIFNIYFVYKKDLDNFYRGNTDFIYNIDISNELTVKFIDPIFEDIKKILI